MQNSQQQAYDRGITLFSPDGRLYQVEYAREAVKRGTASIGVRTREGVVLAVHKHVRSPLLESASIEKLHRVDDHIGIASAGHVADARQLIDFGRKQAQLNRLRYGEPVGVEALTKDITDHVQEYTQTGGARPFGAALLVGGIENGEPRLYETDPSGTPTEWKAVAIGGNGGSIQDRLETAYREDLSVREGVDLALETLARTETDDADGAEDGGTLTPAEVGVATIDVETERFEQRTDDDLRASLERLGVLADD